jgi:hypothetical protein
LGTEILGFEQPSPRRQRGTCDIVGMFEGRECFFEVKRKSADVRQKIPVPLETALTALAKEIGFALTAQLQERDYNCAGLPTLMDDIRAMSPRHRATIEAYLFPFATVSSTCFFLTATIARSGKSICSSIYPRI